MKKSIMTFNSVHEALRAEKTIRTAGLEAKVINTPRAFSNDCGISLVFAQNDKARILGVMMEKKAAHKSVYAYEEE
jgi:hypothetical protein